MLVRMLVSISGREDGKPFTLAPGDTHEFDDAQAGRLIAKGYAEAVVAEARKPKKEKATSKAATSRENAAE